MHCILLYITTDDNYIFCNVAIFQLAVTKDLILRSRALLFDCLNTFRTLKRSFTGVKTSCWRFDYAAFTQTKLGLEPGLDWFMFDAIERHRVGRKEWQGGIVPPVAASNLVFNFCQETSPGLEGNCHLKSGDQSKIIVFQ